MKALSVRQPWASLIASGVKTIELRTWQRSYSGDLLICASSNVWRGQFEGLIDADSWNKALKGPRGVALCVVEVLAIRPATAADASAACSMPSPRDYAWILRNVRAIPPRAVRGRLGLFDADTAIPASL